MMDQLHKELSEPVFFENEDEDDVKAEESDNIESLSELESNASTSSDLADDFETASERSSKLSSRLYVDLIGYSIIYLISRNENPVTY